MHTYTYIYIYLHVTHKPTTKLPFEKFIYARIHIHTHICTHTYTHTYIARIHIHTHILDARANHELPFEKSCLIFAASQCIGPRSALYHDHIPIKITMTMPLMINWKKVLVQLEKGHSTKRSGGFFLEKGPSAIGKGSQYKAERGPIRSALYYDHFPIKITTTMPLMIRTVLPYYCL